MRIGSIFLLAYAFAAADALPGTQGSATEPEYRRVPLTTTLKIPVIHLAAPAPEDNQVKAAPGSLALWGGAIDEPPEGPNGFDVFSDGTLILTDPLKQRLVIYDLHGTYQQDLRIGFAADSITVVKDGLLRVHDAKTGEIHLIDRRGTAHPEQHLAPETEAEAHVLSGTQGVVRCIDQDSAEGQTIAVEYPSKTSTLLSLELIGREAGDCFVALETSVSSPGAESIDMNKFVRRYSAKGTLLASTTFLPLGYFVQPVDELRVRGGTVYQLMTTAEDVRINEWNLN